MNTRRRRRAPRPLESHDYLTDSTTLAARQKMEAASDTLGKRISRIRAQRGLSLEDLASRTGIDVRTLRKVEHDQYTPPLGQLIRLGKALKMKMGYFISPTAAAPYTVVRANQRQPVARFASGSTARHGYVYESLAPEKGDRFMEPFIVTMRPSDEQEMSTHDGQEFIYVLEGKLEARLGETTEILEQGDAIYYDSMLPHLVRCHGNKVTRILAVLYTEGK
jgi:quercetin dioxygenase-like cupin family protein/DNA-binding XRE family transcriptional regulator